MVGPDPGFFVFNAAVLIIYYLLQAEDGAGDELSKQIGVGELRLDGLHAHHNQLRPNLF